MFCVFQAIRCSKISIEHVSSEYTPKDVSMCVHCVCVSVCACVCAHTCMSGHMARHQSFHKCLSVDSYWFSNEEWAWLTLTQQLLRPPWPSSHCLFPGLWISVMIFVVLLFAQQQGGFSLWQHHIRDTLTFPHVVPTHGHVLPHGIFFPWDSGQEGGVDVHCRSSGLLCPDTWLFCLLTAIVPVSPTGIRRQCFEWMIFQTP